jgi:hypothetical protein
MQPPDIFVSYARVHRKLVTPLVSLLRVDGRLIFQDESSILPGQKWEESLQEALQAAKKVIVFWCKHASVSKWVSREAERAAELRKDLIPVILDNTPLPPHLSAFQWVDFREAVAHDVTFFGTLTAGFGGLKNFMKENPGWLLIAILVVLALFIPDLMVGPVQKNGLNLDIRVLDVLALSVAIGTVVAVVTGIARWAIHRANISKAGKTVAEVVMKRVREG